VQNRAAELKLRAERKAGQILADLKLRGGDRRSKRHGALLKLDDLGISRDQSKRWQRLASVPESDFCGYLTVTRNNGGEVTSAGLLKLSSRYRPDRQSKMPFNHQSDAEPRPSDESLIELLNHCKVLDNLLGSSADAPTVLSEAQRRHIRRLIIEMYSIVRDLTAKLPSGAAGFNPR
jgi:hypothetical protein